MKIPSISHASIRTSDVAVRGPEFTRPTDISRGLSEFGSGLGSVASGAFGAFQKYEAEANALAEADATLQLQERYQRQLLGDRSTGGAIEDAFMGTDTEQGFLQSHGLDAMERSSDVLDRMEKDRLEVAEGISDERTRQRFLIKSREIHLLASRQVEGHVAKEFEAAKQGTAAGLSQQFLAMSESGASNFEEWLMTKQDAEEKVRALAPSPEAGEAAVKELQSKGAQAFAMGLLGQGKLAEAKEFVQSQRQTLGSKFFETANLVEVKVTARMKDEKKATIAGLVDEWANSVRDENGFVSEADLRRKARQLDPDDPLRGDADAALEKRVRLERARIAANSKEYEGTGKLAIEEGRAIPSEAEDFLKRYDKDALASLKARQTAHYRAAKRERDGTAEERAEARRVQREADRVFLNELETELTNNPGLDPEEFEKQWIADRAAKGADVSVPSEVAFSEARKRAAKGEAKSEKKDTTERRNLAERFESTFRAAAKKGRAPVDQKLLNERVGEALKKFDREVEANGGKPLSEDAIRALEADGATKFKTGGILGTSLGAETKLGVDKWAEERAKGQKPAPPKPTSTGTVQMRDPKTGKVFQVPADRVEEAKTRKKLEVINAR